MLEVERYHQQLVHERTLQHERWEEQRALLVTTHERYVPTTFDFEQKLDEDEQLRLQLEDEAELSREFNEQTQLEDDIDTEIENLRHRYETQLAAGARQPALQRRERHHEEEVHGAHEGDRGPEGGDQEPARQGEELHEQIKALEREISAHKREIKSRGDTIGEEEKKILKKKNQELEKFKFVLDYKIKELKRQIERARPNQRT